MTAPAAVKSPVTAYAERVLAGEIPVGRPVRLACERHLRDLDRADIKFDPDEAQFAIDFFAFLRHSKGEWAGQPFALEPWQQFIVGSLFGWKKLDGTRRFAVAQVEVARKNGKSTMLAGVGLYLAFFDSEPGAEVYAAATKRDQAKIVWGEARAMVLRSDALKQRIKVLVGNLHNEQSRSKFEPLGADVDGMDGLNIHGAIIDELHAHKTRAMWDVIQTATGARRQPLVFAITTAGYDRRTLCWEQRDYCLKVLEGVLEDDTLFAYVATIDEEDDWRDPAVWPKANPNLGVSVKPEDLERKAEKAKQVPGEVNAFLQLHCDVWPTQSTRWLSDELWDANAGALDELEGRPCYVAIEASSTQDLATVLQYFPQAGGGGDVVARFYCPADRITDRTRGDMVPYETWAAEGFIVPTEGNVTDYDVLRAAVNEIAEAYEVREVLTKRWNVVQLQNQLQGDGFNVIQFGDGYKDMSPGTIELEKLLIEAKIRHAGNPVLRWMASNIAIKHDPELHARPDKEASTEQIGGLVALIMAIGRNVSEPEEQEAGVFFV